MEALFSKIRQRFEPSDPGPRVQVMSDLHLEVCQQYGTFTFPATAPFLILAGDIGRLVDYDAYRSFLEAQVSRYRKVFLVLGNHEFYELDYQSGIDTAQRLAKEPSLVDGLVLLHRTRWDNPDSDLTILGCTLWSAIPEEARSIVESKVSDFKHISGWTPSQHNATYGEEVTWLREQVAQVRTGPVKRRLLVVTHHAPRVKGTSRPEYLSNPWAPAFATDLVGQREWDGVSTWVFGHTHYSARFVKSGIKLVANQRGYVFPNEKPQAQQREKGKDGLEFDAALAVAV